MHDLIDGLVPGRSYAFRSPSPDGKRLAWRRGIPADAGKVTVEYRPTASVTGRVAVPEGVKLHQILVVWGRHHRFPGKAEDDGTFRVEGVPDDAFRIRASGYLERRKYEAEVDARPGEGYELRLEPKKPE